MRDHLTNALPRELIPRRILLLNWRDPEHPKAGGAETLTINWAEAWQEAGADVTFFTNSFQGSTSRAAINGVRIVREGRPLTQAWHAKTFYRKEGPFDLVVEEINTLPFLSSIWARGRSILLMHQLARHVWFYEAKLPLSLLGYAAEPIYLRLYNQQPALVLSESTRQDLIGLGFHPEAVHVIPGATQLVSKRPTARDEVFTYIYVGRITPSKRVDHIIRAFAEVSRSLHQRGREVRLKIVGSGSNEYERQLMSIATKAGVGRSVEFVGWVSNWWLDPRLARSHALVMASVREGWGLVVTEANSIGMPAIGYPVRGLKDSIRDGLTGLLARDDKPGELAREMLKLEESPELWKRLSDGAFQDAAGRGWATSRRVAVRQLALAVSQLKSPGVSS